MLLPVLLVLASPPILTYRILLLLGALGLVVPSAVAQPDSVLQNFEAANEAYTEGRHEQAVTDYEAVLDAGYTSGALYHNLGNAYVRLDRVGPAVWAYERARHLRPSDPRPQHNLEYVRRRAGLPLRSLPPRGLAGLVAGWSPLVLFMTGGIVFGAGLIGAVLKAGPNESPPWHLPGVWGPVGVGLLLVIVALGTSYVQAQDRCAVVMAESVPVRQAPNDTAASDTTLKGGAMLEIQARQNEWIRVRLRDGSGGWMPTGVLGEV